MKAFTRLIACYAGNSFFAFCLHFFFVTFYRLYLFPPVQGGQLETSSGQLPCLYCVLSRLSLGVAIRFSNAARYAINRST